MSTERPPPRREALYDEAIALIGGYTIVKKLGEGGAGKVYACRDEGLGRTVAIKTLHARNTRDQQQKERFLREARAMARVTSAHVVGIHQVGENKGGPYIIMEYLAGTDLETRLRTDGPLPALEAVELLRQVAQGLADADRAGIVHRDVKPANIIVTDGKAKLTDFGLARPLEIEAHVTTEGTFTGTAAFLAPERARGEPDDRRGDIYALGCTLYSLVCGEPPFVRSSPIEVIGAHLSENAVALDKVVPSCPRPVALLVDRMMSKEPAARPQTYAALDAEFAKVLHARREMSSSSVASDDGAYQAQPTGVMGSLKQMGVIELAQMLELQKKTAIISVHPRDEEIAEIAIEEGQLVGATFGALEGSEAFIALASKRDGLFRILYERQTTNRNLQSPLSFLILEALRRQDEESRAGTPSSSSEAKKTTRAQPKAATKERPRAKAEARRLENPLAEAEAPPPPPLSFEEGPTRISPVRAAEPVAVERKRSDAAPSMADAGDADIPAYLSPLDDETIRVALDSDDPYGVRDTAIIDRPRQRLEEREDDDDDAVSMLDRTAEHPAPIKGLSLEDSTDVSRAHQTLGEGESRTVEHTDRTQLSPVLFDDDDDEDPHAFRAATRVVGTAAMRARALAERVRLTLPHAVAFAKTRNGIFAIGGVVLAFCVLFAVVVVLASPKRVDVKDLRGTVERDPDLALAMLSKELTRDGLAPPARADLEVLRSEAFIRKGDVTAAFAATRKAAEGGASSPHTVDFVVKYLGDPSHGDAASDLIATLPGGVVDKRLIEAVENAPYPARNEAWRLLNERGQAGRVDREGLYIKNLGDGPTCRERRVALLGLVESGAKSELARRAVEKAVARGTENVCMERELATLIPKK
jgi:tRNA A-37 threonylcarbamoyl transferase component Bud32